MAVEPVAGARRHGDGLHIASANAPPPATSQIAVPAATDSLRHLSSRGAPRTFLESGKNLGD
jgi:hypothetical protein